YNQRGEEMELKKVTAVDKTNLDAFMTANHDLLIPHDIDEQTSFVIEVEGAIISWFQMKQVANNTVWLNKLFIVKPDALKLPAVLQTIVRFVYEQNIAVIYVHSKQLVTDLLLSSFSFTLQENHQLQSFQESK